MNTVWELDKPLSVAAKLWRASAKLYVKQTFYYVHISSAMPPLADLWHLRGSVCVPLLLVSTVEFLIMQSPGRRPMPTQYARYAGREYIQISPNNHLSRAEDDVATCSRRCHSQ